MAKKKDKPAKKAKISSKTKINQSGSGSIATKKGIAAGAGGVAAQKVRDVTIINQAPREIPAPIAKQAKTKTLPGSLPAGSNIPFPRNTLFTGREKDLELIAESLLGKHPTTTLISQAITGMGGIGKTQLAVEFAYCYGYKFDGVHWLNLANPESLDSEIAACGRAMGLAYDDQREQVANTVKIWQGGGLRLLILDNFEEVNQANDILVRLQGANIRLLITSRRSDWSKELGLHQLPLELFSEKESLDFLESALEKKEKKEERKALAEKLGLLPLALELAAKYININKITITVYLKEQEEFLSHESMSAEWFKDLDIKTPTEHELGLLATFQLSWREVKGKTQQDVFRIAGYCAPNTPIPIEIFTQTLELDEKTINKALYRLNALGLLNVADDLPTIHHLIASFARAQNKDDEILSKGAQAVFDLSAAANQSGLPKQMLPYQAHVRSIGGYAETVKLELAGSLWNEFGYSLYQVADYAGAKVSYERALKIDEASFGPDHPNVARDVNNLGSVLQNLGDLPGAKANFERASKIDEASFGLNHPNIAVDVNNLGSVQQDLGDLQSAKADYERALKIDEASFGPDHPNVARDVNNLGGVLQDLGNLGDAKANFERALKIDEASFGPDHPNVARDVNNLGGVLKNLGDLQGAKANFEHALKIDKATFGPDHPNVARDVNNLGSVLKSLGDLGGAKANYERALKIFEKQFGKEHPNVATLVNNLGLVLKELGDLQGAKANFEHALKINEATFGLDHPKVAQRLWWLGVIAQEEGEKETAREYYQRALEIYKKFLPEEHPTRKSVEGYLKALEETK